MSATSALPAAVAAFIPPVEAFNSEFNRAVVAWVSDPPPDPARVAERARREDELSSEIARTGAELVRLLIQSARPDALAVDLRQFLNALAANNRLPLNRDWPRLKAALQVAAEQVTEPTTGVGGGQDSDRGARGGSSNELRPVSRGNEGNEPDGPFGTDGFRFRGTEVRFGRAAKQRALVLALWETEKRCPRPARPVEDVLTDVYGENHDKKDPTFRELCSTVRERFQTANLALNVEYLQGNVQLVPQPG